MDKVVTLVRTVRSGFNLMSYSRQNDRIDRGKCDIGLLDVIAEKDRQLLTASSVKEKWKKGTKRKTEGEVCSIKNSPMKIIKAAQTGSLEEFQKLYFSDPTRLDFQDKNGRQAFHHASINNKADIVEFIIEHHEGINAVDNEGNTALHLAVLHDSLEVLICLLTYDADVMILNSHMKGAIHIATEYNKVRILEQLVEHKDGIATTLRGRHGRTALHVAAIFDRAECIRILLSKAACCPRITCENGYYAIHEAAKNASASALKAILEWGHTRGVEKEEMMTCYDADGNVPLHSAVHAGDIKAVKLCLESGANISTQQHDLSTPVHLACAQGAIDIVKLMFSSQKEQKLLCLEISDAQQMTPLHYAAMFDHQDLVEYLVSEGADINIPDKEGRSVLLLSAARGAWNTVKILLKLGANIFHHDNDNRNLLHHIVLCGGSFNELFQENHKIWWLGDEKRVGYLLDRTHNTGRSHLLAVYVAMGTAYLFREPEANAKEIGILLNEKDSVGCTPMHYASLKGHLKTVQSLLFLGAIINVKNNESQCPLHFAARYGRYNTVRHLLETRTAHLIINEMDGDGMTSLHIASQNGHVKVVQLLLIKGALLHRDHKGRTPLHYAASSGYTQTMEQLLAVHSHLLDQTDREGNTALHLAVSNNQCNATNLLLLLNCKITTNNQDMTVLDCALNHKHREVMKIMVTHSTRSEEIMKCKTTKYSSLTEGLIATMPDIMMVVLDRGITKAKRTGDSKTQFVKYDFNYLQKSEKICPAVPQTKKPLPVMNIMVRYGRTELMSHPLCVKYLETKWSSYGMYFHLINLAVYTVFLLFITANAVQLMHDRNSTAVATNETLINKISQVKAQNPFCTITSLVIMVFVVLNIIKELYQIVQQKAKYFFDVINLLEWALYLSAGVMAVGHMFPSVIALSTEYIVAATAVFLAWFNYLLYLQRFNKIGIYVVMFLEILSTLLKVMFVFSVLLIAFGLSFYILLSTVEDLETKGFFNPSISLARVSTMMLGEIDFLGTFLKPLNFNNYPVRRQMAAAIFFLMVFAVLMPILLMNLLIGLAVGDIETVRKNAQLKRLTMQVELHTNLERKLPKRLLQIVDKMEVYEYPNKKCASSYMWSALQKWFDCPKEESRVIHERYSSTVENIPEDISEELSRQKKRLNEMSKVMDQQLQLLRLIVQKMEIRTENGDIDEGVYEYKNRPISAVSQKYSVSMS